MPDRARVIFMGTPDYAVPSLRALAASPLVDVTLVVTQPDRPQGRGRKLQSPPVRVAADELALPVLQVDSLRNATMRQRLMDQLPDLMVVAAFGIILGKSTLVLPRLGCVNLHASLLPAYRGANPIAAAIAAGETQSGVTLMQMERGLDTGPILGMEAIAIVPDDTTGSLTVRLAGLAAHLLVDRLLPLLDGAIEPQPQPDGATLTRPMTKDDGWIEWQRPAAEISAHIRAMSPWPRAWTSLPNGTRLQVHSAAVAPGETLDLTPGEIRIVGRVPLVGTGSGTIELRNVQLPGGRPLEGQALADRFRSLEGTQVGITGFPEHAEPLVMLV